LEEGGLLLPSCGARWGALRSTGIPFGKGLPTRRRGRIRGGPDEWVVPSPRGAKGPVFPKAYPGRGMRLAVFLLSSLLRGRKGASNGHRHGVSRGEKTWRDPVRANADCGRRKEATRKTGPRRSFRGRLC
jgi:hypothetical protein